MYSSYYFFFFFCDTELIAVDTALGMILTFCGEPFKISV